MNELELALIDEGLQFLEGYLTKLTKSGLPADVIEGIKAAYEKLLAHKDDPVTKANLEANRG